MTRRHETAAIRSFCTMVALTNSKRPRLGMLRKHFSPAEINHLAGVPGQTAYGRIALKKAILHCVRAVWGERVDARDIVLSNEKGGAPKIESIRTAHSHALSGVTKKIKLSVSHGKTHAFGLAVVQVQEPHDDK
jgi:phosphopantetheinyl transferase (holo-ACP synthase)